MNDGYNLLQAEVEPTYSQQHVIISPVNKWTIKNFSGKMFEDPEQFLSEFHSFKLLSGLANDTNDAKKIAAFHLNLNRPALCGLIRWTKSQSLLGQC